MRKGPVSSPRLPPTCRRPGCRRRRRRPPAPARAPPGARAPPRGRWPAPPAGARWQPRRWGPRPPWPGVRPRGHRGRRPRRSRCSQPGAAGPGEATGTCACGGLLEGAREQRGAGHCTKRGAAVGLGHGPAARPPPCGRWGPAYSLCMQGARTARRGLQWEVFEMWEDGCRARRAGEDCVSETELGALITRAAQGDQAAFRELYHRSPLGAARGAGLSGAGRGGGGGRGAGDLRARLQGAAAAAPPAGLQPLAGDHRAAPRAVAQPRARSQAQAAESLSHQQEQAVPALPESLGRERAPPWCAASSRRCPRGPRSRPRGSSTWRES